MVFVPLQFKCCGSNNSHDWMASVYISSKQAEDRVVPDSCCKTITPHCGKRDHPSNIYKVEVSGRHTSKGEKNQNHIFCLTRVAFLELSIDFHWLLSVATGCILPALIQPQGVCKCKCCNGAHDPFYDFLFHLLTLQGGCITKLEQFLADHLLVIGAVGIGVACLQVSKTCCVVQIVVGEAEVLLGSLQPE